MYREKCGRGGSTIGRARPSGRQAGKRQHDAGKQYVTVLRCGGALLPPPSCARRRRPPAYATAPQHTRVVGKCGRGGGVDSQSQCKSGAKSGGCGWWAMRQDLIKRRWIIRSELRPRGMARDDESPEQTLYHVHLHSRQRSCSKRNQWRWAVGLRLCWTYE